MTFTKMKNIKLCIRILCIFSIQRVWCSVQQRCSHMEFKFDEKLDANKTDKCVDNDICKKNYTISYIEYPPYSFINKVQLRLKACCGQCVNITKNNHFNNISELDSTMLENSDFIYPVLGSLLEPSMYGYYFIPICPVPEYMYITLKLEPVFTRLLGSIDGAYPLIVICILMTIVSGFITWVLERWFNEKEFPRGLFPVICILMTIVSGFITWVLERWFNEKEFPRGLFPGWIEGIWWSFISMTTVGYGDKTPRSVLGRIYAIVWILIGITMFGILTGLLTSAVMEADKPKPKSIKNENVGVLRYRLHDASLVAMHDGKIVETNGTNFYEDLILLMEMLQEKTIEGMVLDKLTYWSVKDGFTPKALNHSLDIDYPILRTERAYNALRAFNTDMMTTEKKYLGERQAYGVLVRDKDVYEYFRDAMADNKYVVQMGVKRMLKRSKDETGVQEDLFSFTSTTFQVSAAVMAGITLAMSLFGLLYTHFWQSKLVEKRDCAPAKKVCVKETKFDT